LCWFGEVEETMHLQDNPDLLEIFVGLSVIFAMRNKEEWGPDQGRNFAQLNVILAIMGMKL
jgi:hypothetical protein